MIKKTFQKVLKGFFMQLWDLLLFFFKVERKNTIHFCQQFG